MARSGRSIPVAPSDTSAGWFATRKGGPKIRLWRVPEVDRAPRSTFPSMRPGGLSASSSRPGRPMFATQALALLDVC